MYRENFATLASSIVCESEKLASLGEEVAHACMEDGLKKVRHHMQIGIDCNIGVTYSTSKKSLRFRLYV